MANMLESPLRRRLLQAFLAGGASACLPPYFPKFTSGPQTLAANETQSSPEKEKATFKIFGLHDTPNQGGSIDIPLAMEDAKQLKAKWWVALNPSTDLIQAVRGNNLELIARFYKKDNRFGTEYNREIEELAERLNMKGVPIQIHNEINLMSETGGVFLAPEEYAESCFLPTANLIAEKGSVPLLVPLAQGVSGEAGMDDMLYLERILFTLAKHKNEMPSNTAIAVHNYIFGKNQDPWQRIKEINELIVKRLGVPLPIYVTEAGVHQDSVIALDEEAYAQETIQILASPMPADIPVKAVCFWVYANFAQRPKEHEEKSSDETRKFERAVWRGKKGPKKVLLAVGELAVKSG